MSYFINQKEAEEAILPTLPIPLHSKEKGSYYKVNTLLDSGSTTNWITEDLLKNLDYKLQGDTDLEVYTINSIERKKFKLVEVYYTKNNKRQGIMCYAHEKFTQHTRVRGMVEFIKENSRGISYELIDSIIDPITAHSDHSKISRGVGMVLCSAAITRIRNGDSKTLENIGILLEPTIFGTVISGRIPESLRGKTEQVCSLMTTPRTVRTLEEPLPTEGVDEEWEQWLKDAKIRMPSNDQSQWDNITVEVHQEEDRENGGDWAEETIDNKW